MEREERTRKIKNTLASGNVSLCNQNEKETMLNLFVRTECVTFSGSSASDAWTKYKLIINYYLEIIINLQTL